MTRRGNPNSTNTTATRIRVGVSRIRAFSALIWRSSPVSAKLYRQIANQANVISDQNRLSTPESYHFAGREAAAQ